ncbi:hypothetical protein [Kordia sp.]|uniref:hypothetical protein n=1 Tax=Kordia sp. TaxID=1965332 RepID=UPI003D6BF609
MKKQKLQRLHLNKKSISNLNHLSINGGAQGFTSGCTDGCASIGFTLWNCSLTNCTADCPSGEDFCNSCTDVANPGNPMNPENPQAPSGE